MYTSSMCEDVHAAMHAKYIVAYRSRMPKPKSFTANIMAIIYDEASVEEEAGEADSLLAE
jgi:hypothetical protein